MVEEVEDVEVAHAMTHQDNRLLVVLSIGILHQVLQGRQIVSHLVCKCCKLLLRENVLVYYKWPETERRAWLQMHSTLFE